MDCNNCETKDCFNCESSKKFFKGNNPLTEFYTVFPREVKDHEINEQYLKLLEEVLDMSLFQ